jgi:hypothetical protein
VLDVAAGCNGNERPYLLEIAPFKSVTELTALISRKSKKNRPLSRNKGSESLALHQVNALKIVGYFPKYVIY